MKKIFETIKTMSYEKGAQYLKEKGFGEEDASKEKDFADLYFFADRTSENWSVSENGEVENGEKI